MSKAFIDTNIFAYAMDLDMPQKQQVAVSTIAGLAGQAQVVVSTQVMQELYSVATRKIGIDPVVAKSAVRSLQRFEVATVSPELVLEAIDCSLLSHLSFWDALIIVSAESAGCDRIITEDLNSGQIIRGMRIENPFAQ